jgi:hypothetical protein
VKLDPLAYACPACGARPQEPCTRLGGTYGTGNPLRRMHPQRRLAGIREEVRRTRRHV